MKFIGITGGVGAGKSTVLDFLEDNYNVKIIKTDQLAKELMKPGTKCNELLHECFKKNPVFNADGSVNNSKMAELLFDNDALRNKMNSIVHPAVKKEVLRIYQELLKNGAVDVLFVEAALLIEEGYDQICDELWYIYADQDVRRARLKESRGYSDSKIDAIMSSQLSDDIFREKCSVIINNSYEEDETFDQIDIEMEFLLEDK